MDQIDPLREYISWTLTKQDCYFYDGLLLKIIKGMVGVNNTSYLLIDDCVVNIIANPTNSILISPYLGSKLDTELLGLSQFLIAKSLCSDIKEEIPKIFDIEEIWRHK